MNTRKLYGSKPMTSFALALPQSDSDDDLCNSSDSDIIHQKGNNNTHNCYIHYYMCIHV